MAGGILWFTHISMKNINIYKYPIGKLRMQPVGIIIFAAVMATLGNFVVPRNILLCSIDFFLSNDRKSNGLCQVEKGNVDHRLY